MATILANTARLKPEIRLAQTLSQFETDLSSYQREAYWKAKAELKHSAPGLDAVMMVTSEINSTSRASKRPRCVGTRFTSFLEAVQQFAALGDVIVSDSLNLVACSVWVIVQVTLLVGLRSIFFILA